MIGFHHHHLTACAAKSRLALQENGAEVRDVVPAVVAD